MKRLHLSAAAFGFDTPVPAGPGSQALLLVSVTQEDGTGVMGLQKQDFTAALFAFGPSSFGLEQPPLSIVRFTSEDAPFYSMVLSNPPARRTREPLGTGSASAGRDGESDRTSSYWSQSTAPLNLLCSLKDERWSRIQVSY